VNYVRDLVAECYVGEVLSTTLIGSGMNWGPFMDTPNAYTADRKNGATLLTIPFGHTIDGLCYALGELREVAATTAVRRTSTTIVESGATIPMTAEDQIAISGRLEGGAVISAHYRGGMTRGTGLLWEINGSEGDLQMTSIGGHAQLFELSLRGGRQQDQSMKVLEIPSKYRWAPAEVSGLALNVAQAYVRLAADLHEGTQSCPGFEVALARHRLLAAIETAAETGKRVAIS